MYMTNMLNMDRDVAIYARVSTEHEEQLSALENQKEWYKPILSMHPEWHFKRMYVDEGITGTSARKRPQFMKMIKDAQKGEFNMILTREVSRFARNTVDTLQFTRALKAKGVEVYFINDNIRTFDGDGELRLTIMATLAQDESRKTSIRVRAGQKTSMEKGVLYGTGSVLGYDRVGKDFVVNEEQARTVRMIFDMYLSGKGTKQIKNELERRGRLTATGKTHWHEATILRVLRNSLYCGIITYRKQYVKDFLEQKKYNNFGEVEKIYTRGPHTPLISEEDYRKVQKIIDSHGIEVKSNRGIPHLERRGVRPGINAWTRLIECGECGHRFNRAKWHKENDGTIKYGYVCYAQKRTGSAEARKKKGLPPVDTCEAQTVPEWKLQLMIKTILNFSERDKKRIINKATKFLRNHFEGGKETPQTDKREIDELTTEVERLKKRIANLVDMRLDGEISREIFESKKKEASDRILILESRLKELSRISQPEKAERISSEEMIKNLRTQMEHLLSRKYAEDEDVPDEIIEAYVAKIKVYKDHIDWYLRMKPATVTEPTEVDGEMMESFSLEKQVPYAEDTLERDESTYTKVYTKVFTKEDAQKYRYADSSKNRVLNWKDLTMNVYV